MLLLLFCINYPHTYLHSSFFFLSNSTNYVSQYSFTLRDCWDIYIPVKKCASGMLGSICPTTVLHLGTVGHLRPKTCGHIDLRRLERIKALRFTLVANNTEKSGTSLPERASFHSHFRIFRVKIASNSCFL